MCMQSGLILCVQSGLILCMQSGLIFKWFCLMRDGCEWAVLCPRTLYTAEKRNPGDNAERDTYAPQHGVTLADLIPESAHDSFKEQDHMQPALIKLVEAAMGAVQCDCILKDTRSAANQLQDPISRPDCTLIAAGDMAVWTQVVSLWAFKSGSSETERETMFGQQVERCRHVLDSCDQRHLVVAVLFTMTSLEVMTAERQEQEHLKLSTSGPQPFSISKDSPGFQLLVKLLSTAKIDLGFVSPSLPPISQLKHHRFIRCSSRKGLLSKTLAAGYFWSS